MNPLQQLKESKRKLDVYNSAKELLYDFCPDFHFEFDVEISKRWTKDEGTEFAPVTWQSNHYIEIVKLKVLDTVYFDDVELSESELDEIAKELLTKIEIQ